jgi:hypothetical protein
LSWGTMRPYWRTRRPCWRIRCLRTFSIWTCCAISVNNNQNDDQWDLLFIFIEVSAQYLHVNQEQNQNMIASMLPYLLRIPNKSQHINQWKNISALLFEKWIPRKWIIFWCLVV